MKHHGVIMKLDPDGKNLEVVCRGFRVPNGVAVGPNGEITTSDQEGHWDPFDPRQPVLSRQLPRQYVGWWR